MHRPDLAEEAASRRSRLFTLAGEDVDCILVTTPENIFYVTGYWSMAHDTDRVHPMAALVWRDGVHLVCPASDFGAAMEVMADPAAFSLYGRCHLEVAPESDALSPVRDRFPDFHSALDAALERFAGGATSFLLEAEEAHALPDRLAAAFPNHRFSDGAAALQRARAVKLPCEVGRLRNAAAAAEAAIAAAFADARQGMSEWDMAATITHEIVKREGVPGFVVVTSGPRAALADAYPSKRRIEAGDLVRVDVGCAVDGYWADTARTASMGEPSARDQALYRMISDGEAAQLNTIRSGMQACEAYQIAIDAVREAGLPAYRRHHCGHGLGIACHEYPTLSPDEQTVLEPGMVLCVETPLYQLRQGGMMVEDTLVVETDGVTLLTELDRGLWVLG